LHLGLYNGQFRQGTWEVPARATKQFDWACQLMSDAHLSPAEQNELLAQAAGHQIELLCQKADLEKALSRAETFSNTFPDNSHIQQRLTTLYLRVIEKYEKGRDWSNAIAVCERLLGRYPHRPTLASRLQRLYLQAIIERRKVHQDWSAVLRYARALAQ